MKDTDFMEIRAILFFICGMLAEICDYSIVIVTLFYLLAVLNYISAVYFSIRTVKGEG